MDLWNNTTEYSMLATELPLSKNNLAMENSTATSILSMEEMGQASTATTTITTTTTIPSLASNNSNGSGSTTPTATTTASSTAAQVVDSGVIWYSCLAFSWFVFFISCFCKRPAPRRELWRGAEIRERYLRMQEREQARKNKEQQTPKQRHKLVHYNLRTKVRYCMHVCLIVLVIYHGQAYTYSLL